MADNPIIRIWLSKIRSDRQKELLALLKDKKINKQVNEIVGKAINRYVPKKSGALRASIHITPESISWGTDIPYARYQYHGEIYGPNFPGAINGAPAWKSPAGEGSKHPTGRTIGAVKGIIPLYPRWQEGTRVKGPLPYKFGYTTRGTQHHWDKKYTYKPKMKVHLEVTRLLKRECKKRGLKT